MVGQQLVAQKHFKFKKKILLFESVWASTDCPGYGKFNDRMAEQPWRAPEKNVIETVLAQLSKIICSGS